MILLNEQILNQPIDNLKHLSQLFKTKRNEFVRDVINAKQVQQHLNTDEFSIKKKCLELKDEVIELQKEGFPCKEVNYQNNKWTIFTTKNRIVAIREINAGTFTGLYCYQEVDVNVNANYPVPRGINQIMYDNCPNTNFLREQRISHTVSDDLAIRRKLNNTIKDVEIIGQNVSILENRDRSVEFRTNLEVKNQGLSYPQNDWIKIDANGKKLEYHYHIYYNKTKGQFEHRRDERAPSHNFTKVSVEELNLNVQDK